MSLEPQQDLTPRQKVQRKLDNVKQSRKFFGQKNPSADFTYVDTVLADAERFLSRLPDKTGIVYKPVWDRTLGAESAMSDAVQDDLKGKFRKAAAALEQSFVTSVIEVCTKVYAGTDRDSRQKGRNLLIQFTSSLGNSRRLFALCMEHSVKVPDSLYNEVARLQEAESKAQTKSSFRESELSIMINEESRRKNRRPIVEVDNDIVDLGNNTKRLSDREEMDRLASTLVKTVLETVYLRMVFGQNPKTYEPQWECRQGGQFYVLDRMSPEPPAENVLAAYEIVHKAAVTKVRFNSVIEMDNSVPATAEVPEEPVVPLQILQQVFPAKKSEKPVEKKEKVSSGMFIKADTPSVPVIDPVAPVKGMTADLRANAATQRRLASVSSSRGIVAEGVGSKAAVSKAKRGKKG